MIKNSSNFKFLASFIFILVIIAIFVAVKIYFSTSMQVSKNLDNLFFKSLNQGDSIDKIKEVHINYEGQKLTLVVNEENKWLITEKHNFPALNSKIKEIIFGLADAKIIEAKTSRPENFVELNLQGLDANKNGTKITLLDINDKEIDSVYLGKREFIASPSGDYLSHIFVRRPSEHQTWLISTRLPESFSFKDLVAQPAIPIDLGTISEINLVKPKNPNDAIKITRNLSTGELNLLHIPPRYKVKDQYIIDNILQQLSYLNYEDIVQDNSNALKVLEAKVTTVNKHASNSPEQDKDVDLKKDPKTLKYHFDIVYLNNNYYLKLYDLNETKNVDQKNNSTAKSFDYSRWLYKINDYACQSLLIEKKDLLTLIK